jgi:hypothetical protein
MTCSELAATWLTAIGTLATAIVAVVTAIIAVVIARRQEEWRRERYHPTLGVTANIAPPDCLKIPMKLVNPHTRQVIDEAATYYLRAKITNTGTEAAKNVEVYAKSLYRLQGETRELIRTFPPMTLVWSNRADLTYLPILAPHSDRHCDIAHIIEPSKREMWGQNDGTRPFAEAEIPPFPLPPNDTALSFDLKIKPLTRGYILAPGTYSLEIEVSAENAEAIRKNLRIELDGRWEDSESTMLGQLVKMRLE